MDCPQILYGYTDTSSRRFETYFEKGYIKATAHYELMPNGKVAITNTGIKMDGTHRSHLHTACFICVIHNVYSSSL